MHSPSVYDVPLLVNVILSNDYIQANMYGLLPQCMAGNFADSLEAYEVLVCQIL